jgi:hypothetical protein
MWARAWTSYSEAAALSQVKALVASRFGATSGRLNFIMAVPVVNWETTLVEHAQARGSCHHIPFESRGFFDSALQWREWRAANLRKLEAGFEAAYREDDINILFLYLSEFHVEPAQLARFRCRNVIVVHFNWDDRLHYISHHNGQSVGVRGIAQMADFSVTMAIGPLHRYAADKAAVFYWRGIRDVSLPDATLPKVECERLLFFGSRYGFRKTLIEYLRKKNLPIDVYGAGWGTEFISYEALAHKIPRYALNLGVSTIGYTRNLTCVKGRDIEVPLAGGLYLTNHGAEIRQVYTPGKEILTYRSMDDCYRQSCEVLSDPSAFSEVRRNGARRAGDFSWPARFEYLIYLVRTIALAALSHRE